MSSYSHTYEEYTTLYSKIIYMLYFCPYEVALVFFIRYKQFYDQKHYKLLPQRVPNKLHLLIFYQAYPMFRLSCQLIFSPCLAMALQLPVELKKSFILIDLP